MHILIQGFILGAVGGLVPGAVLTILLVSTLQGGFAAGLKAFFAAMASEVIIAGTLLLVAIQLSLPTRIFVWVGLIGGLVLFYFAWQVAKLRSVEIDSNKPLFSAPKIFLLSATNAPLYIFWITICFPLIWQLAGIWPMPVAAGLYFVTFEVGWGLTTFLMVMVFLFSRQTLTNVKVMRMVFIGIALVLAGFGLKMLVQSILTIL